jgi:hypothetical protein
MFLPHINATVASTAAFQSLTPSTTYGYPHPSTTMSLQGLGYSAADPWSQGTDGEAIASLSHSGLDVPAEPTFISVATESRPDHHASEAEEAKQQQGEMGYPTADHIDHDQTETENEDPSDLSESDLNKRNLNPNMYKTKAENGGKRFCNALIDTKYLVEACTPLLSDVQRIIDATHDASGHRRPHKYTFLEEQATLLNKLKSAPSASQNCSVWTDDVRDHLYDQSSRYLDFTAFRDGRKPPTE